MFSMFLPKKVQYMMPVNKPTFKALTEITSVNQAAKQFHFIITLTPSREKQE